MYNRITGLGGGGGGGRFAGFSVGKSGVVVWGEIIAYWVVSGYWCEENPPTTICN